MRAALLLGLPALILAAGASAQTGTVRPTPRAQAHTALIYPLTVIARSPLDFGWLAVTGTAGTAVINPNTGQLSVTGGVSSLGGQPRPATFVGAARSAVVVNIKVPNQPITLTRVGGAETMQVRNFTLQGQDKRSIARMTSFEFNVGGTLVVAANQPDGLYTGSFDVLVQYP